MSAVQTVEIRCISVDALTGELSVVPDLPGGEDYEYIWRDASGIRWDASRQALVAYEPSRWPPDALFRQIRAAVVGEYGQRLMVSADTLWAVSEPSVRERLEAVARE